MVYHHLRPDKFGIYRDPEGQASALDGRFIHISKDVTEILAKAGESGNLLSQQDEIEDPTSIDWTGQPSINGLYEFGHRAYDHRGNRRFHWERRDDTVYMDMSMEMHDL
ncbi:hypothetical protein F2Q70_00030029 [Brassica cretica]|uniref:Uncharacterized protein n=2 Tax=Brassica cretica TaxID=69181 RepID=A0A3N6R4T3_BRACR|nr:hypothetical protein F2Q70_00030029 [Brassica cretica]KAF2550476.1 hypothetical protein F2Q68_00034507 [Brassica cretica]KAF3488129.1 hypothetical protein F2Q69_00053292 [Brassica cretica]KAF3591559.1 hypothetical protein DY000_02022335 [Brassica cretica]